ncbi:MAG TPA: tRNA guanosine(34) transglycosylase Tgt [Candidatus Pacearchaeota archaeon]|nr:tRNA guanosine(34) transglycosylase Tgt [Candidatus Pacearchaeota archaeon]
MSPLFFRTKFKKLELPLFFPDATRAVIKTLDSKDIKNTKTKGVLVNTYHLYKDIGEETIKKNKGIRNFMNWQGGLISDSGGFQVLTLAKESRQKGKITDRGVVFSPITNKKVILTPEKSIEFQMIIEPDMVIVLDDFTNPKDDYKKAKESVERTVEWAKRSKEKFLSICNKKRIKEKERPYLLGVVQGGNFLDLRDECVKKLVEIGFDGLGFGGWPIDENGKFNFKVADLIAKNTPKNYFLFGLGIGKPEEIIRCFDLGFSLFDCVLPTRDARHKRLYVYNAPSIEKINIRKKNFYSFYFPDKEKYRYDNKPISNSCDCLLCKNYSKSYLFHLFKIKEMSALRLATIHNLRFYSILMEKLKEERKIKL